MQIVLLRSLTILHKLDISIERSIRYHILSTFTLLNIVHPLSVLSQVHKQLD